MAERAIRNAAAWEPRASSPWVVAPLLLLASAALSWAYADHGLPPPDEGAYLTAASRILDGLLYYRDIDAYPFPGASYLLALAMGIFGEHLAVARALAGGVFSVVVLGTYAAALALVDRPRAALCGLASLSLKFLAFPIFTMYFYADLAMATSLVALAVFLRHERPGASVRLAVAGIFVGLAIVTKQNAGIYVAGAMGLLLAWPGLALRTRRRPAERLGELAVFAASVAVPVGVMSAYFASEGLFGRMVSSGLLRPFTGYLPASGVSFLPPLRWWEIGSWSTNAGLPYLPFFYVDLQNAGAFSTNAFGSAYSLAAEVFSRMVYTSLPVALIGCAWLRGRARRDREPADPHQRRRRARFFSGAVVCTAIAASAFPRADLHHVMPIYPAVLLVLAGLGSRSALGLGGRPTRPPRAAAWATGALLLATGALGIRHAAMLTHHLVLERADLRVRAQDAWVEPVVRRVRAELPAGAPLFVYGHEAQLYFLTDRYSPWPFSQLYPGMAGGDGGATLARLLEKTRPALVLQGIQRWPGMTSIPEYTPRLRAAIHRSYVEDTAAFFREHPPDGPLPPKVVFELWRRRGPARAGGPIP